MLHKIRKCLKLSFIKFSSYNLLRPYLIRSDFNVQFVTFVRSDKYLAKVRSDFNIQYVTIVRSDKSDIFDAKIRSDFKVQYVTIVRSDKPDIFDAKIRYDFKVQFVSIVRSDKSEQMLPKVINSLYPSPLPHLFPT